MEKQLFSNLQMYYPFIANRTIECRIDGPDALILKLDDGSTVLYDDRDHSFRRIVYSIDDMTEDDCRFEFADRLRRMMNRRCMTISELSILTDLSIVTLSRYLNRQRTPNLYVLTKLANALNCSIDDFTYKD